MIELQGLNTLSNRNIADMVTKQVREPVQNLAKNMTFAIWDIITTEAMIAGDMGSPVWTGAFNASHRVAVNYIDRSYEMRPDRESTVSFSALEKSYVKGALAASKLGDIIYISNSVADENGVSYARAIESGELSGKVPFGVYSVAADAVKLRFNMAPSQYLKGSA